MGGKISLHVAARTPPKASAAKIGKQGNRPLTKWTETDQNTTIICKKVSHGTCQNGKLWTQQLWNTNNGNSAIGPQMQTFIICNLTFSVKTHYYAKIIIYGAHAKFILSWFQLELIAPTPTQLFNAVHNVTHTFTNWQNNKNSVSLLIT